MKKSLGDISILFLVLVLPIMARAASPHAVAGDDQAVTKNTVSGSYVLLDGSRSTDPDGDSLSHTWYGPFSTKTGPRHVVHVPEGRYTVSLMVRDTTSVTSLDTITVTVEPCLNLTVTAVSGSAELAWAAYPGARKFYIYRAAEAEPSDFVQIGEAGPDDTSYTDTTVEDEKSYLYLVGAVSDCTGDIDHSGLVGEADLSLLSGNIGRTDGSPTDPIAGDLNGDGDVDGADIAILASNYNKVCWFSACNSDFDDSGQTDASDLATFGSELGKIQDGQGGTMHGDCDGDGDVDGTDLARFMTDFGMIHHHLCFSGIVSVHPTATTPTNYDPLIYSLPVTKANTDIIYNYHVRATDPNGDNLTYAVSSGPLEMDIDATTGLISWTPVDSGTFDVTMTVDDGHGGSRVQAFEVVVSETVPENSVPVTNPTALWDQGQATLIWDEAPGMKYQIYRGMQQTDIAALAQTEIPSFVDTAADYYKTYYYQLATVKEYADPVTGQVIQKTGPLTDILTLAGLPAPEVSYSGVDLMPDGSYTMIVGPSGPYEVTGSYGVMSGSVVVSASSGDDTATATGSNGSFAFEVPGAGDWQITVAEQDGWMDASMTVRLVVDDQPPQLTVDGSSERTTTESFVVITGSATDTGAGLGAVELTSDQYAGQIFGALVDDAGAFTSEVPLKIGENNLTVTARDKVSNETQQDIKVVLELLALPSVTIQAPADGAVLLEDRLTVSGLVHSSLQPEQIRLILKDQMQFPAGTNGEYTFSFEDVVLVEGTNTLEVRAETIHGNASAFALVNYQVSASDAEEVYPTIKIQSPRKDAFLTQDHVAVSGTAESELGIADVTVNGQQATITGAGTAVSFHKELDFSGQETLQIAVVATDTQGKATTLSFSVHRDTTAPTVQLTDSSLQLAPEVNSVTQTPFGLTGTVTERNLAGLSVNGRNVSVLPGQINDTWSFDVGVVLERGQESPVLIQAWDLAGNRTSQELILRLDATVDIEIISPAENAELIATEDTLDVEVVARITGMTDLEEVRCKIDDGPYDALDTAGLTATGTASMTSTDGEHMVTVEVTNQSGDVIGATSIPFSVTNADNILLSVDRQEPADGAIGVEPNAFIAFYFNKAIDPALLQVEVLETAHGKIYATPEKGADITQMSKIELIDVHRDREHVPGGMSHFPEHTMAAFYPERDFAYGGTLYVTVFYDGQELSRSSFQIRPLPTFIQGFVADHFMRPLEGIEVEIPELGRVAVSDNNGSYEFGFGEPYKHVIPAGRYEGIVNPGLKNRAFGSVTLWMNVEEGRLNSLGITRIPILNVNEPFRRIYSGQVEAVLAAGDLVLDLTDVILNFPDGSNQGDVHVQFMEFQEIAYSALPSSIPHWVYSIQPVGVEVSGEMGIRFFMPRHNGSHDYVERIGDRVLLVGINQASLKIVPIGVGLVDSEKKEVLNEGPVHLERLDIIGYALVSPDDQSIVESFAQGEIGLQELIGELETPQ